MFLVDCNMFVEYICMLVALGELRPLRSRTVPGIPKDMGLVSWTHTYSRDSYGNSIGPGSIPMRFDRTCFCGASANMGWFLLQEQWSFCQKLSDKILMSLSWHSWGPGPGRMSCQGHPGSRYFHIWGDKLISKSGSFLVSGNGHPRLFQGKYHGGWNIRPFGQIQWFLDGFYHGKPPRNHHSGEYVFTFSRHLKQIKDTWWKILPNKPPVGHPIYDVTPGKLFPTCLQFRLEFK